MPAPSWGERPTPTSSPAAFSARTPLRHPDQSERARTRARRLIERLGRGGGRRARRFRAGHRHRRIGAHPGELLRHFWHPSDPWAALPRRRGRAGTELRHRGMVRTRSRDPGARRPRRLIVATDAFAIAEGATAAALYPAVERIATLVERSEQRAISPLVPLSDWFTHQRAAQGREAWATFGAWIDRHNPRFAFEISDNFIRG